MIPVGNILVSPINMVCNINETLLLVVYEKTFTLMVKSNN